MSKSNSKQNTHEKSGGRIIRNVLLVIFSLGFLVCAANCVRIIHMNRSAQNTYTELSHLAQKSAAATPISEAPAPAEDHSLPVSADAEVSRTRQISMDFSALKEINPEICAWLSAESIGIDYPVMHTDNNDYYLTHLYNGEINKNGALFVDCGNSGLFDDGNTVIYGHNMQGGSMFHALNEYKSQEFYDSFPEMTLYTPDGDYKIELLSGTIEDGNSSFVQFHFDDDEHLSRYMADLLSRSTFRSHAELQAGDRLVSLCTCTYELNNARYMLVGRLVELYK